MRLDTDLVFKALTRPATLLGVPLAPLLIAFISIFFISIYTSLLFLWALLPTYLVLKLLSKFDEKIFQVIGIKRHLFAKKLKALKFKSFFGGSYYSASDFSKINNNKTVNNKKGYEMLDLEKCLNVSEIIPYSSHIAEDTVFSKEGSFLKTWEIEGISFETRDSEELDFFKDNLALMLRQLEEGYSIYVHSARVNFNHQNSGTFNNYFAEKLDKAYFALLNRVDNYQNKLYLTLIYKGNKEIGKGLKSTEEKKNNIKSQLEDFTEISLRVEANIRKFGIKKLGMYEEKDRVFSSQLEFYNFLLTNKHEKIAVLEAPIYSYLGGIDIIFGKDVASIEKNGERVFARGIEIKDWVQFTNAGLLNNLMKLNCRYVLTQSYSALSKNNSRSVIDRQIKQLRSTDDDSISQQESLLIAKDALVSGDIGFGEHHLTLFIYADDLEEIKRKSSEALSLFSDLGFITTYSSIAIDEAYFSQLPANFKFRPRTSMISSDNFAGLNSLHNNPIGKSEQNCWGKAVSVFKTSVNTPFYFNFHQTNIGRNDLGEVHLGHSLVLGKSGTGKTALCTFLLSQTMKFEDPNSFPESATKKYTAIYLDKDYGAEIGVRALGGKYNKLINGESTRMNPFMLDNTPQNIEFLTKLILILATHDGSSVSSKERSEISFAVNSVMSLPKSSRKFGITRILENIQQDFNDENSLASRLKIWSKNEAYGWVFDNEDDEIDLDSANVFGFDGTEVLDNEEIIEPLAYYLLYRIQMILDGRRVLVFLDEFWKWLGGESFKEFVYDGLKTFRKRNGSIIMISQSPDEILRQEVSRTIIEQVETFIYLPNSKASAEEYKVFNTSEKEFEIIRGLADDSRQFLVKKGNSGEGDNRGNTVLVSLDLGGIDKVYLKVLSASSDSVRLMEKAIKEGGENPQNWLPIFKELVG